jgi:hypothetical protein
MYHACSELLAIEAACHADGRWTGEMERSAAMQGTNLDDLMYLYKYAHQRVHQRYEDKDEEQAGQGEAAEGRSAGAGTGAGAGAGRRRPKPPPRAWKPSDPTMQEQQQQPTASSLS